MCWKQMVRLHIEGTKGKVTYIGNTGKGNSREKVTKRGNIGKGNIFSGFTLEGNMNIWEQEGRSQIGRVTCNGNMRRGNIYWVYRNMERVTIGKGNM